MKNFKTKIAGMNNHYRYYQLETFFASLAKQDIHFAEVWTGPMHFYVDSYTHEDVKKLLDLEQTYAVKIIGICPEQTNPKPNNIATKTRKEEVLSYYKQIMDVAKQVSCSQILVTSGWAYLDENKEEAWGRSIQMMKQITKIASTYDLTVVMEALQPDESILVNTVNDLKKYIKEVNSEYLKVCIDFGAMARANESISDYFTTFKDKIAHIHFVDGAPTGHFAWGDGNRNLKQDLEALASFNYEGYLSLETATSRYYAKPWEGEQRTLETWEKIVGGSV